eukprot:1192118-Amphidinium_carterae.1
MTGERIWLEPVQPDRVVREPKTGDMPGLASTAVFDPPSVALVPKTGELTGVMVLLLRGCKTGDPNGAL